MEKYKEYVVLEHLTLPDRGLRFFTTNSKKGDNTLIHDGTVAYKEILFTDSTEEAQAECRKANWAVLPTMHELEEYYREQQNINEYEKAYEN
jgi:hypothetical protein